MNLPCRICSSDAPHAFYRCREKMFGWGDEFAYFECDGCGCLQIATIPPDLGRFYPANYYSFNVQPVPQSGLKSRLAAIRDLCVATNLLGRFITPLISSRPDLVALARVPARKHARILDVGCGRGFLLSILHRAGFDRVGGIDPYLPGDIQVAPGLCVRKAALGQINEQFDLIILNHVFEHIESGAEMLALCEQHLSPQGTILMRFPVAGSEAWETYRENWLQLDAPRHMFLHTRKSFQLLAARIGLEVKNWICDSDAAQFWASELYQKGIPLIDRSGVMVNPADYFTKAQMKQFIGKSRIVNANGRGDQVSVLLTKKCS